MPTAPGWEAALSDPTAGIEELGGSLQEALETLAAGRATGRYETLWTREETGEHWYLHRLAFEVAENVEQRRLQKLIEVDRSDGADLFETLEVYLDTRGNASEAAKRLFVHRNTLQLRLDKISERLEIDLNRPRFGAASIWGWS